MTEEYKSTEINAPRVTAKAMDLIIPEFEEIDIERPQMVAKLLVNLEQGMQKGLIKTSQVLLLPVQGKLFH